MAERSPFERVFDPTNTSGTPIGNMLGLVGTIGGVQTDRQRQMDAEGAALADLSSRVQQGATPQKAFMDFLQTPQGQDAFSKGVTTNLAQKFMATINPTPNVQFAPPGTTPVVTRPGQGGVEYGQTTPTTEQSTARTVAPTVGASPGTTVLQQPQGEYGFKPAFRAPTTEAQTFDYFKSLSGLPPEQSAKIAELQMLPPDQRDSETTRYFRDAVKNGSMPQDTADKLRTGFYQGVIKIVPKLNRFGEQIGSTIFDVSDPNKPKSMDIMQQTPGGGPQPSGAPPAIPGSPAAAAQEPPLAQRTNRSTMFFGAGLPANVLAPLGKVVRGTLGVDIPVQGSEEASANQRNLQSLQTSLVQLAKDGSGLGVPIRVISAAQSMGPDSGMWSDPKTALAHAIDLHANLLENVRADTMKMNDYQVSKSEKEAAEKRVNSYEQILRQLPSIQEMTALQKDMAISGPITRQNEISLGQAGRAVAGAFSTGGKRTIQEVRKVRGAEEEKTNAFTKTPTADLLKMNPNDLDVKSAQEYRAELDRRIQASKARGQKK